jgi:putative ABC transport system permease protein
MSEAALALGPVDLVLAAVLVLAAGGVSVALRLGLGAKLALASVRTVVQLLMVGWVLRWVFASAEAHPIVLIPIVAVMVIAAALAAVKRPEREVSGMLVGATASLSLTGLLVTVCVTAVIIGVQPWWRPQYFIPLLGMVFGNTLTGLSLAIDHALESFSERGDLIEAELALGATRWEAAREQVAAAVRRGMIPILNSMTVVGLVSLPGMMTGQILQGADPMAAVEYQIVVMFMLAASVALSAVVAVLFVFRRVFDAEHRLRRERIQRR